MDCACATLFRLDDEEAKDYAAEHLRRISVDYETWTVVYRCDKTGKEWILDYPRSEYHGGGPPRLRQLEPDGIPIDDASADDNT